MGGLCEYKRFCYEKDECLTRVYYELKKYTYALENILKRYKEKEETESRLLRIIEHSILKSKVKEKLKKIKARTDCKYCNNTCDSYAVCKTLEELLEEGK